MQPTSISPKGKSPEFNKRHDQYSKSYFDQDARLVPEESYHAPFSYLASVVQEVLKVVEASWCLFNAFCLSTAFHGLGKLCKTVTDFSYIIEDPRFKRLLHLLSQSLLALLVALLSCC